ncbi:MAG: sodium:proton antiporter [Phenylobacterium sp.]|uniref:cation:proton antiporter n=1 Tax=Phenylobacterium sp. TaxID=1871053 RepID=UPI0012000CF5|nr:cation:proton antiporter [Phenylobacterium sp.]TAJ69677.1 MAG: sodium:proton antiporter [Phenylobacterium sp.]
MSFFESLLVLLAVAILLLQVSRRLTIPYPTMLAAAGVGLAVIPGAPAITLDPHMALALFIAPALVDAAFDFPVQALRRFWRPLFALAVLAVIVSAGTVAWLGVAMAGLPLYAALALGAIAAPPDAAAATAVLSSVSMPRRSVTVLKGESLLNDATALLLFSAAVSIHTRGEIDAGLAVHLGLAAPGGLLLGFAIARLFRYLTPFVTGTLGGNLMEFVSCFGVWIIAERLGLSPVLCLVAFAMTIARTAGLTTAPRVRIHSFAVWSSAVFLLNVLAFLLMGFQARAIVGAMEPERLREAAIFALSVIACVIATRMVWVMIYNRVVNWFPAIRGDLPPPTFRQGILVGWCGMRGLVTLATAFALPASFPQRDLIVLTAFAVVLATLVVQGLTLAPLVRLLKLDGHDDLDAELAETRARLAAVALTTLDGETGPAADHWRYGLEAVRAAALSQDDPQLPEKRRLGLKAIRRQREHLEELRAQGQVGGDTFLLLQEELDFSEVALVGESGGQIQES